MSPGGARAQPSLPARALPPSPPCTQRRLPAWIVGLAAGVLLTIAAFWNYYPPLPEHLRLTRTFDAPRVGVGEPLVVTGEPGTAEFIYVKYLDEQTVVFGYDIWGQGGPISPPVRIVRGRRHTLDLQVPALTRVIGTTAQASERLRLDFDGATVLEAQAGFRYRSAQRLWFGRGRRRRPVGDRAARASAPPGRPRAIGSTHRYIASAWLNVATGVVIVLTFWACVLNPAVALHTQGESDWVPPRAHETYRAFRHRVDRWLAP